MDLVIKKKKHLSLSSIKPLNILLLLSFSLIFLFKKIRIKYENVLYFFFLWHLGEYESVSTLHFLESCVK